MKKIIWSSMLVLMLFTSVYGLAFAADTRVTDKEILKDLAAVRRATEKFHDVDKAIAAGYVATPTCTFAPGIGGMGYHYINFSLVMDPAINLTSPEVLLYEETGNGLKLVGVEYFLPIGAPDAPIPNPAPPAPVLFGRAFDGPMLGHEAGMPPHYDLHVWVWQANPDGMFAQFNPNVICP